VVPDASASDIIPDASFLPPHEEWTSIGPDDLEDANAASRRPLNNGNLSPGVQTYLERIKELSINNSAAFRTIRRIPPPTGESPARLGNAYEFFKNLEFISSYWDDTSLPPRSNADEPSSTTSEDPEKDDEARPGANPPHLQINVRSGSGTQLPPEYRTHLLTAFVKLVAYDFGCNVSFPRCEPRLQLTPSLNASSLPPSYFPSALTMVYRTPKDRASARTGVVEGPLAAISCRNTTNFTAESEAHLDLAREINSVLLTAQQRAREGKTEERFGQGKWWTEAKRWGGGKGGLIGKEGEKIEEVGLVAKAKDEGKDRLEEIKQKVGGFGGPSPPKRSKKEPAGPTLQIYDNYRKMIPPSSTWDRKARYMAIGKLEGQNEWDDVFLVSSLNHHVSIIRVRVPTTLLDILAGAGEEEKWERLVMWRSKWFDLFLKDERIEAMKVVWGMMAWLMREIKEPAVEDKKESAAGAEKMVVDS